ncbi:heme o synthase [Cytobacillus horneckiae]|uniref:Protoheme IX farnesyltransferase n=1 Tax=Cytobacillus horneckiae TaxID=549687 RepID=A0A2N0ZKF1_9BACI|nr:heme o synthase [Cytobacillus horneckiae]NRG45479.1 protoheme IX farnesyltransferase [Bacillus sp. CRN 9]MCM3178394.1 heme o synthase [Cytobacillus horneckiae]MEC1156867.1 heme o synthase [Cytobacillus horneckiae]MED2940466.1 heme o synthase [Cytobacillus horneckiae]PKG29990.1 protoheme IX farnesyltransferase [Cytobacillus horneckiae]
MSEPRALGQAGLKNGGVPATTVWKDIMALIKVGIVNSNAITTFTGLWLALHFSGQGFFNNLDIVIYTLLGSSLIIAGSCSLNNYIDRDIDHLMDRTKGRPTVTGKMNPTKVAVVSFILIAAGTAFLMLTTWTAVLIGLVGVFSYIVLYTIWSKRRYVSNTIVGSISGAVPPLIGWAAVDANLHPMAWGLFLLLFLWQPPHFYALAMRRVEEYRAAGVPMLPVVKGFKVTKVHIYIWIAALLPLPFLFSSLGIPFTIFATLLTIGWLLTGIYAKKFRNDRKWATLMFVYSIQYLTILCVGMVIVTLI